MKKYRPWAIRALFILLMPFLMNYVYTKFWYEDDLRKNEDLLHLVNSLPQETEIVYLGESSNITPNKKDTNWSSISTFLAGYYPSLYVYDITKPAAHAGVYKELLKRIPPSSPVKTVVLTLNLRSFGAGWIYSDLETSLQKSMVLLRYRPPLFNRFLLAFKAYDHASKEDRRKQCLEAWEQDPLHFPYAFPHKNVREWDNHISSKGMYGADGTRDQKLTETACHFVKNYAFCIDTLRNPRIRDVDEIVELARRRGWNLVLNLMAENTERAAQLAGEDLVYLMEENRKLLVSYYERKGVPVVDNLHRVPDSCFSDRDWPTEHYTEQGRRIIARNVAETLRVFHPAGFVLYEKGGGRTRFFNNCEWPIGWDNMESLRREKAFRGKWSSRAGGEDPFSITFSYRPQDIPAYARSYCSVELEWLSAETQSPARLILELEGGTAPYTRTDVPLAAMQHESADWNHFRHEFTLPAGFPLARTLKVYVHNPSEEPVFIDDIRISFR
ncbi:MAG: DUF4843 domain-containing protein [Bacteroidia bacterium]|nr:DUF4843 domain-containing protein [Bacteroidia bacterium]